MLCTAWNHHYVMTVRVMNSAQVGDLLHVPDRCPLLTCWHTRVPIDSKSFACVPMREGEGGNGDAIHTMYIYQTD